MFSCLPADHLQAPVLARSIASEVGDESFLLVSAVDHDSHLFTVELTRAFAQHKLTPSYHYEFKPGQKNIDGLIEKIINSRAHSLVLIAAAQQSAQIVSAVRQKGFNGSIFGGPCMGRRSFIEQAGDAAEEAVFPLLYTHGKGSSSFEKEFTTRFGKQPDYLAAHTYDATNLLIEAIRKVGLNRALIRDAISELSPWKGVTGAIKWDPLGSNNRTVRLGAVKAGRVISASELHDPDESKPRYSQR
jgi:branched-chain amino acid transport system substrate-binding protein